jgi:hypothetical protein
MLLAVPLHPTAAIVFISHHVLPKGSRSESIAWAYADVHLK